MNSKLIFLFVLFYKVFALVTFIAIIKKLLEISCKFIVQLQYNHSTLIFLQTSVKLPLNKKKSICL